MGDLVWMKHEFPWLGSGFVHAVADQHALAFAEALHDLGFSTTVVEGSGVVDDRTFWVEIKRAFGFPDCFGSNWDAFNDCFGDLDLPSRLAVIWRRSDLTAAVSLKLLVEGIAFLCGPPRRYSRWGRSWWSHSPETVLASQNPVHSRSLVAADVSSRA